jgi:hypothetical protein
MDLFHEFCNRKIILKVWKITEALDICRNTPELFQNYIFIIVILHFGLYLTFYNYD